MIRNILLHPDPRLKTICAPVEAFDAALSALAQDMLETMYDAPGIGLAGPQVGVMQRICVVDCAKEEAPARPMILINPQVIWVSDEKGPYEEGCLSLPGHSAEIMRPTSIRVAWQDLKGADHEEALDGLWATCVQHEVDHLDGKLFIDYLMPVRRQMITRKMQKHKREQARL